MSDIWFLVPYYALKNVYAAMKAYPKLLNAGLFLKDVFHETPLMLLNPVDHAILFSKFQSVAQRQHTKPQDSKEEEGVETIILDAPNRKAGLSDEYRMQTSFLQHVLHDDVSAESLALRRHLHHRVPMDAASKDAMDVGRVLKDELDIPLDIIGTSKAPVYIQASILPITNVTTDEPAEFALVGVSMEDARHLLSVALVTVSGTEDESEETTQGVLHEVQRSLDIIDGADPACETINDVKEPNPQKDTIIQVQGEQ